MRIEDSSTLVGIFGLVMENQINNQQGNGRDKKYSYRRRMQFFFFLVLSLLLFPLHVFKKLVFFVTSSAVWVTFGHLLSPFSEHNDYISTDNNSQGRTCERVSKGLE